MAAYGAFLPLDAIVTNAEDWDFGGIKPAVDEA
jgi:hypothetical protein